MSVSFEEFNIDTGYKAWEKAALAQLKGKSLSDIPKTKLGLSPYYKAESKDTDTLKGIILPSSPCKTSFTFIVSENEEDINKQILSVLAHGIESLSFEIEAHCNFTLLFKDVHLDYIDLHFSTQKDQYKDCSSAFSTFLQEKGINEFNGSFTCNDSISASQAIQAQSLYGFANCYTSLLKSQSGNVISQIAHLLLQTKTYIEDGLQNAYNLDQLSATLLFNFQLSKDTFESIAGLRALRKNLAVLLNAYSPEHDCSTYSNILCYSDDTLMEKEQKGYTNILRSSLDQTICYLGNANYYQIQGFDLSNELDQSFSNRISSNIPAVLKEESFLGEVRDPLKGAYYIEKATEYIIVNSWKEFSTFEKK